MNCPTCSNVVAGNARACPHCGQRFTSWVTWLVAAIVAFVVFASMIHAYF